MNKNKVYLGLLFFVFIIFGIYLFYNNKDNDIKVSASVSDSLSNNQFSKNFSKADKKINFEFPKDSGSHDDFQTEWWYYTGNLEDENKNDYGFQLTIFRRALDNIKNESKEKTSEWRTKNVYFAHFTVSDIKNKKFYFAEKYSRNGAGLAGAEYKPINIWLENWQIKEDKNGYINLKADNYPVSINLDVKSTKPVVLQGDKGLSRKSENNYSYYYSLTRLDTNGYISIDDKKYSVKGLSWLDREWSTSALSANQTGWDWFSLHFENNTELMLYQLRLKNGEIDSYSSGTFINEKGQSVRINRNDFTLKVLDYWKSPDTNVKYPSKWLLEIPKINIKVQVEPLMNNQELNISFAYWEGAVKVSGSHSGKGYVELTGYNEKINSLSNR